jgi:signal transduction histidine kinase/ActR/RegA family two-component response regulator
VQREPHEPSDAVVIVNYPPLDHLLVRIGASTFLTGSMHAYDTRPFPTRHFAFPIHFSEGEIAQDIALVARSSSSLQAPILVKSTNDYLRLVRNEYLVFGTYYGAVLALLVYNLFIFLSVRESAYLHYIFYGTCYLVFQMTLNGVSFEFLWPTHPEWSKPVFPIMIGLIFGFIFLFIRRFLSLADAHRHLDRVAVGMSVLSFSLATIVAFVDLRTSIVITVAFSIVAAFLIVAIGLYMARHGMLARIFLLAWTTFLLGIVTIGLKNFGVLPSSFITDYGMQIGSACEMMLLSFGLGYRVRRADNDKRRAIHEMRRIEQRSTEYRAIARTTQMLAHDVRKPFTMLMIGLDRMATIGSDPSAAQALAIKIRNHVGKAYEHVQGLLADVMAVSGDQPHLRRQPQSVSELLTAALGQVFRYDETSGVSFAFDLRHTFMLDVDPLKIQRVFVNILDNARQAMRGRGRIWVRSQDVGNAMIEITLGNSDSLIPPENLSKVFDAFFTSGKQGGTGLGLAICHKLVTAHGGTIRCSSSTNSGTEFMFTLPRANTLEEASAPLPKNSAEVRASFEAELQARPKATLMDPYDAERRSMVISRAHRLERPLAVLVVDDEPLYAEGIRALVAHDPEIAAEVQVTLAASPGEAIAACSERTFDLVICDVDLGRAEISGFELVACLRERLAETRICIHSNRNSPADYRESMQVEADAFLPKPMTAVHLWGLLAAEGIGGQRSDL